ncbi:MAG: hypothetical protein SGJ20_04015 [Planctomycetota bacterium]|nr:hypothetical protein [Planctomycetota bacterium]
MATFAENNGENESENVPVRGNSVKESVGYASSSPVLPIKRGTLQKLLGKSQNGTISAVFWSTKMRNSVVEVPIRPRCALITSYKAVAY